MRGIQAAFHITICIALSIFAGCATFSVEVGEPLAGIEKPLVVPLPIVLGLHFPADFDSPLTSATRHLATFHQGSRVRASIELAARSRFRSVKLVKDWKQGGSGVNRDWDLLLVPRARSVDVQAVGASRFTASYVFAIYDPAGQLVHEYRLDGYTSIDANAYFLGAGLEEVAARAMRGVLSRWLVEFCNPDAIRHRIPSCVSELPEARLGGVAAASPPSRMVLVPWPIEDSEWTSDAIACLQSELTHAILPEEIARNAIFPWFETATLPRETSQLDALFGREDVRRRLSVHARYIVFIYSVTEQSMGGPFFCGSGGGGAGCLGVASGERKTQVRAFVYDMLLENTKTLEAIALGQKVMLGILVPLWHTSDTTGVACRDVARQLRAILDMGQKE
jgi:hypothetical protein